MSKRVFTILLTQRNSFSDVTSHFMIDILKTYKGAYIRTGYDPVRFIACFCFKEKQQRDEAAKEMRAHKLDILCRNDGIIEDEYYNKEWYLYG